MILCIISIFFSFLEQSGFTGAVYLGFRSLLWIEMPICAFIIAETCLRVYLEWPKSQSLGTLVDLAIGVLCIIGILISLKSDARENLGNTTCDTLLLLRNIIFLLRLIVLYKNKDTRKPLKISTRPFEEELVTRSPSPADVTPTYKNNYNMFLEDEDEDYEKNSTKVPVWKGRRISS